MLVGLRAQSVLLLFLVFSSEALCAAPEETARPAAAASIALLLPLDSPDFAVAADAVRLGCQAATALGDGKHPLDIVRTSSNPEAITGQYEAAVRRGAGVVVGPMTRPAVTRLAGRSEIPVATLALNVSEAPGPLPPNLHVFGLSVEAEARYVAGRAMGPRLRKAVVVAAASPLARRVSHAFADEWLLRGGVISGVEEFSPDTDLARLHERLMRVGAEMVFFAGNAEQARAVRPYLNNQLPVYAVSQVYSGPGVALANSELNGVRFVDMPWLVEPDHPAVMIYPRNAELSAELQRLYALGIDACRIADALLSNRDATTLDGVTGRISLRGDGRVDREPVSAVMKEGLGVPLEAAH
jgi:outer membrane PBP1 activator LpoA protein